MDNYLIKEHLTESLSDKQLNRMMDLVKQGGAVDPPSVDQRFKNCHLIVAAYSGDEVVGVGTIKRSRHLYNKKISKRSSATLDRYVRELGYIAIHESHSGHNLCHKIVAKLLTGYSEALFAITDNNRVKKVLHTEGFEECGTPWEGRRGTLSLWFRPVRGNNAG